MERGRWRPLWGGVGRMVSGLQALEEGDVPRAVALSARRPTAHGLEGKNGNINKCH